ncbi:polysialyltransferase family glycosyltransferase [uncultured Amnibacterium sp.]|uniref:polysialyltransferase family glycosyltransferase n=1 Tax=uncultured Amnibacterium sp. TaxID=1631851 RepID=UPI0035CC0904
MQHVFEVATGFGLCGVAAIIDRFDVGRPEDRVLLVANTVPATEASPAVHESPEYAALLSRFGRIVSLNDLIAPEHPFGWSPAPDTHHARLATAQLLAACGIAAGEPHTLWIESIQGTASQSLARLFDTARIHIYADGLMTYGPTRIEVPSLIGDRIDAVVHLDLVPGHGPWVLREFAPDYRTVPVEDLLAVLGEIGGIEVAGVDGPVSVVVGQYLADLGLLTVEQDALLLERMVRTALAAEPELPVLVRAHPRSSGRAVRGVVDGLVAEGHDVRLLPTGGLVETLFDALDVRLVVSCFSTALFTARAMGIRTVSVGAASVLRTLRPYQNSNRMAIVLADLLHESVPLAGGPIRPAETDPAMVDLVMAVTALSMQPGVLEHLHGANDERVLALPAPRLAVLRRYVSTERLLRLIPGLPRPTPSLRRRVRTRAARVPALRTAWRAARRARAAWSGALR